MKYSELEMFKSMKGELFIEHIQKHLKEDKYKDAEPKGVVICKICNKDVDTIAEEELIRRFEAIQPLVKRLREAAKGKQCPECSGSGVWVNDERGNEYKTPVKCEDCNGTGRRP